MKDFLNIIKMLQAAGIIPENMSKNASRLMMALLVLVVVGR
jgi:hypothetical protein